MRTICVANQKGGTGKTTTVFNLAGALAELKKRVLVIDLDPQGGLTVSFGFQPRLLDPIISDVLADPVLTPLPRAILPTKFKEIDLVGSNKNLAATVKNMDMKIPGWHDLLKAELQRPEIKVYDYILFDTQPDLTLLSTIALYAADFAVIPLQCQFLSLNALGQLVEFVETVKQRINPELRYKVLFTMFTGRTIHEREVAEEIRAKLNSRVFNATITQSIQFANAGSRNTPLILLDPEHKGSEDYRLILKELLYDQENRS